MRSKDLDRQGTAAVVSDTLIKGVFDNGRNYLLCFDSNDNSSVHKEITAHSAK